jgi:putative YphP/YqiW family bacilliredoxin
MEAELHRYPEMMIAPMRREVTDLGAQELRTPDEVDQFIQNARTGMALIVVNSVCGCAAGSMRPGLVMALEQGVRPDSFASVFAGADVEATERAREYFQPYPPSSPAIAVFRDGELVTVIDRRQIQGRPPEAIAGALLLAVEPETV